MPFSTDSALVGSPIVAPWYLPDTTARAQPGLIFSGVDPFWGGGEFIYLKATSSIRQFGLVVITPTLSGNQIVYGAAETGNTANQGRMLAVAMVPASSGQFFWACMSGTMPINCNASVAAGTTIGIAAAGQGGANSAGKQILNAVSALAATQTVAKTGFANSNSTQLFVNNSYGWFAGLYLSGTGIAASTTITDISPDGTTITLSSATTAQVNGTVTGTYNNATVFYNVCHFNRPFAQGAIT